LFLFVSFFVAKLGNSQRRCPYKQQTGRPCETKSAVRDGGDEAPKTQSNTVDERGSGTSVWFGLPSLNVFCGTILINHI